uniref:Uncharacterized protein n=1 Tax=Haplochromis burtoni TaxID=8153 RepID=A0A3Q2VJA9_HAPBU
RHKIIFLHQQADSQRALVENLAYLSMVCRIVSVVLLLMICVIAVLMWCLSRHKGEYVTNEMEEKDEDADSGDGDSVGSDEALQSEEPLTAKEEK